MHSDLDEEQAERSIEDRDENKEPKTWLQRLEDFHGLEAESADDEHEHEK